MNTRMLAFVSALALAAAMLLETADVEPESPAWTTAVPEDDGVTGWELAPLNVQVIDSLSGERVPFLSFTARDKRGETLAGCTDIDGRVRGYEELSVGTVHVDLTIGAHADDLAFGGVQTVRRGARLEQPKFPHGGDPEEPSVWEIKAQRLVPLKIDVPAPLLDHVEIWLASGAVRSTAPRRHEVRASEWTALGLDGWEVDDANAFIVPHEERHPGAGPAAGTPTGSGTALRIDGAALADDPENGAFLVAYTSPTSLGSNPDVRVRFGAQADASVVAAAMIDSVVDARCDRVLDEPAPNNAFHLELAL